MVIVLPLETMGISGLFGLANGPRLLAYKRHAYH